MRLQDISQYSDEQLFNLIAKYAVWHIDEGWEWIEVLFALLGPQTEEPEVHTITKRASHSHQQDCVRLTKKDVTNDFRQDRAYASEAFMHLRHRVALPEHVMWRKATFKLYPDGKFNISISYKEQPDSPQELNWKIEDE